MSDKLNYPPGPWIIETLDSAEHYINIENISYDRPVRVTSYTVWKSPEDSINAARLIAAAPDMYEALKAAEDAFSDLFTQCCSNPIKDAWGKPVNLTKLNSMNCKVIAAIAKAEGVE